MQIGGVEIADFGEGVPVENPQMAVVEFHGFCFAQFDQRAADGGQGRGQSFGELGLRERESAHVCLHEAGFFGAVILFAEKMGEAHLRFAAAVVGDGFAKDGRVDQRFFPERETHFGAFLEKIGDGGVWHQRDSRFLHRADRMVHSLEKKRLRVRHIARDVEGEILPPSGRRVVIAGEHALQHDQRFLWLVTLPQDVFVFVDMAEDAGQPANGRDIGPGEERVLREFPYQYIVP